MKELKNLIKVRSIIALTITGIFAYMAVTGKISAEVSAGIISPVILAYFATKESKTTKENDK